MKRRKWKQLLAGTLAFGMVLSTFAGGGKAVPVQAEETSSEVSEWEKLSAILDSYPGIYIKDTKLGSPWNTSYSPDGPLMGNGTVYAFMAGDRKVQNIYISHSNMWQDRTSNNGQEYTTFGGITIKPYSGENLALNKSVTVSGKTGPSEDGIYMVDGKTNTKWCATQSNNGGSTTYWAVVDLGENCEISRWVVKHAQAGGEGADWNARDFELQYYDGEDTPDGAVDEIWKNADTVTGNTASVTDRNLAEAIRARYIRLRVTTAAQNGTTTVRIPELELYAEPGNIQQNAQEFRYVQDMKNAEVTAQSENGFTTVSWLSARENILVTEITNVTENELPLEVTAWTANANTDAAVKGNKMIATKAGISKPKDRESGTGTWEGWTVNLAMASQVIGDVEVTTQNIDTHNNSSTFVLTPGQKVTLVSAIEGGKQEGEENTHEQAIAKATAKLDTRLTQEALDASKQNHRDYWKSYWLKSYIDIQDEAVERMYYGMMYQLGCSTSVSSENNGGTAAGLFPWTANNHPAWQGDYTTNTDFQRQIHPLVTANRTEGIENYLNVLEQYWPEARRRAESVTNLNWVIDGTGRSKFTEGIEGGALFPTHIGPWGASTEQYNSKNDYFNSPADATAVLMPVIKEWKYTLDEELLDRLYPLMKSVSIFWENYVVLEGNKYVVYGATHEGVPGRNAILDVDACKYMLKNTILAANELGVDSGKVEIWQNILDNMSPVPTFMYNGKETICDVEGRTQNNTGHTFDGNPVTIQSVYYYDSIGMTASDAEKEKYINYLNVGNGRGSHRRLVSATRLGYDINEIMEQLKSGSINPSPSDWSGLRGNNTVGDIGATAMTAIVQDSLIQSNEGFINIFANWYDNQETSFRRLRTENAFLVDADMNEFGQVTYANIHSEKGRDCSVLNPWPGQEMEVYVNGKKIEISSTEENSLGTVYTFETKAGADYELKPAGGVEEVLILSDEALDLMAGSSERLSVTTNVENAEIIWTSSDQEVAIVGKDGSILALNEGTAVIKVSLAGSDVFAECEVTVKLTDTLINVAPNGTATANSQHDDYDANRAINGKWEASYEGWVSANESWDNINERWLQIDLGEEYTIEKWVLKLDGHRNQGTDDPVGDPEDSSNWGDYYLQVSEDGVNDWLTIDFKKDNKTNTIDQTLEEPVTGRYFRIYMEFPMFKSSAGWKWSSGFARLNQVELYAEPEVLGEVKVTGVQKLDAMEVTFGTDFEALALPEMVTATLSNDMIVDFPVSWEEQDYNGEKSGEYTINGTLQLPAGITNPDNLTATVSVKVNVPTTAKELLQKTYDYALTLSTEEATDSAREYFEKALANAKEVLENSDAAQEVVNKAWNDLVDAIHGLGVVKGDLTYLKLLIDKGESMMVAKDKYVDTNWQKLVDELTEAKAVYDNGDAQQEDIEKAVDELLEAIQIQRYKANKDNLKELIDKADQMDLSGYTKESVAVFKNVLAKAKVVLENESLSVDDEKKVDQAEKELNDAIKGLVKSTSGGQDNGNDTGKGDSTSQGNKNPNAPKTGDMFPVMFWGVVMLLTTLGTAYVFIRRRIEKK